MRGIKGSLNLFILLSLCLFVSYSGAESRNWQRLDDGLFLGEFEPKKRSKICNRNIVILKIDPRLFSFRLLSASEHGLRSRTAKEWCEEFSLAAAINASMYQSTDMSMSTGYMRNYGHINNPSINSKFGAFMVFNPIDPSLPEARIVDRRVQKDWKEIINQYNSVVQNYRMISQGQRSGWPQQNKIYSTAAVGIDKDSSVLFILSRSPYSTYDFINILLSLPIKIQDAMYVEGGAEATLHYSLGSKEETLLGRCENLKNKDVNRLSRSLPNIIGVIRR